MTLWLGGAPATGKTTVARELARLHGLRRYHADAHTWEHRDRAIAAGHADAIRWEAMTPAERWAAPVPDLVAMSLHHERGAMIAADVHALPAVPLTIAEGTPITPAVAGENAVWLVLPAKLQRARLASRGLSPGVQALYEALAEEIDSVVDDARKVSATGPADATAAEVAGRFRATLGTAPTATTDAERGALSRYANAATVTRYETYFARPWTVGAAETTLVEFDCECGRRGCAARVELAIGDFPSGPLIAPAH